MFRCLTYTAFLAWSKNTPGTVRLGTDTTGTTGTGTDRIVINFKAAAWISTVLGADEFGINKTETAKPGQTKQLDQQ